MRNYLRSPKDAQKQLVRFHYADKEDMFDLVSYQKGGQILTMLRNYLTDDVFFAGLTKYLTDNKFGTGEAHQLRLEPALRLDVAASRPIEHPSAP